MCMSKTDNCAIIKTLPKTEYVCSHGQQHPRVAGGYITHMEGRATFWNWSNMGANTTTSGIKSVPDPNC